MKNIRPPIFAEWIIKKFTTGYTRSVILGDLEEEYYTMKDERGKLWADWWYRKQALKTIPKSVSHKSHWGATMFKNYFKIGIRSLLKQKAYSFINIAGLAFGLTVTIILTFYVLDDLSYDKFHEDEENIYRLLSVENSGSKYAVTSGPLLPAAKEIIPEVKSATRITMGNRTQIHRVDMEDETSISTVGILADPDFFDVFSFKILSGENAAALKIRGNVFLTPEVSKALFGDEDPIGKPIRLTLMDDEDLRVAGIVESPPYNSHLQFGLIASLIPEQNPLIFDSWDNQFPVGYVLLNDNANLENVENKIIDICRNNNFPEVFTPRLQPLSKIHLGSSDIQWDFNIRKNNEVVVYTLGAIGILVLLVACINFINLSTSRASKRAREVGIRKVVGSRRKQITIQFLGESILMTVCAFFLALIIIQITNPFLETILNKQLNLNISHNLLDFLILGGFTILTGILSGIYPSIVLSSFEPVNVLKGEFKSSSKGILMRRILVVFQFAITTSLIIAIGIIYSQINFLQSREIGYNKENIMAITNPISGSEDTFKQKLSELPGVISTGRISNLPNDNFGHVDVKPEGTNRKDGYQPVQIRINYDLFDMLRIPMIQGRNFSTEFYADTLNSVIVNEELVRTAGWSNPIGKGINFYYDNNNINTYRIVGVVKDFHYGSSKQPIEPIIFHLNPRAPNLLVRLYPDGINETVEQIEKLYAELYPEQTFRYTFFDDIFNTEFNTDWDFARNISVFAGMAIFIACLGLIGLLSYTVEQRRKEVAVRKILGCSETKLVTLITSDFLKWILIANVIAWPSVYFAMETWLNGFAYKASFTVMPYLLGGIGSLTIAMLTTLYQVFKAARTNPVESLRTE